MNIEYFKFLDGYITFISNVEPIDFYYYIINNERYYRVCFGDRTSYTHRDLKQKIENFGYDPVPFDKTMWISFVIESGHLLNFMEKSCNQSFNKKTGEFIFISENQEKQFENNFLIDKLAR